VEAKLDDWDGFLPFVVKDLREKMPTGDRDGC
jgi:hypothetical protein